MKRILMLALATAIGMSLAGWASEYIMSTNDGRMLTSYGKPKLDKKTGMYRYEDEEGREAQIRQDEVKQIIER